MNRRPHINCCKLMCASHLLLIGLGLTLGAYPGYANSPKVAAPHIFFPPPPDEAHVQFLASFASEEQLAELAGKRNFFRFIVGQDKIQRMIKKPYGITTSTGKIFICDTVSATVEIADLAKRKLNFFRPGGEGSLGLPVNIAVDSDGTRYITDAKRKQVLVFKEDNYVGAIGKRDELQAGGVALTKNRIYVTDIQNHCVRVYGKAGRNELFTFPKAGETNKSSRLFSPTNLAVDAQGRVQVTDTGGFCVNVFDAEGNYLRTIGEQGNSPGTFSLPKGVAVDREGRTYVADAATQVFQIFDPEGRVLMYFGDPTLSGGGSTCLPAGVAVDYENVKYFQSFAAPGFLLEYLILVTNQAGGEKVSVFGFGHKK